MKRTASPATRRFHKNIQPTFPGILYRAAPAGTTLEDIQPREGTLSVPKSGRAHMLPRLFEGLLQIRYSTPGRNVFNAPTVSFSTSASTALARIWSEWDSHRVQSDLWVACPERPLDLSSYKNVQRSERMLRDASPETRRVLAQRLRDVNHQTGERYEMRDVLSYGKKWGQQLNEVPVPRTDLSSSNLVIVPFRALSHKIWGAGKWAFDHWSNSHYDDSKWNVVSKDIEEYARDAIAEQVYGLSSSTAQARCARHQLEHSNMKRRSAVRRG